MEYLVEGYVFKEIEPTLKNIKEIYKHFKCIDFKIFKANIENSVIVEIRKDESFVGYLVYQMVGIGVYIHYLYLKKKIPYVKLLYIYSLQKGIYLQYVAYYNYKKKKNRIFAVKFSE
jgi:hypothetical protein